MAKQNKTQSALTSFSKVPTCRFISAQREELPSIVSCLIWPLKGLTLFELGSGCRYHTSACLNLILNLAFSVHVKCFWFGITLKEFVSGFSALMSGWIGVRCDWWASTVKLFHTPSPPSNGYNLRVHLLCGRPKYSEITHWRSYIYMLQL